jgi:hypothetical protein
MGSDLSNWKETFAPLDGNDPPPLPEELTWKWWDKKKGALSGSTGITAKLKELEKEHKALNGKWPRLAGPNPTMVKLFEEKGNPFVSRGLMPLHNELAKFVKEATPIAKKLKEGGITTKKTGVLLESMIDIAKDLVGYTDSTYVANQFVEKLKSVTKKKAESQQGQFDGKVKMIKGSTDTLSKLNTASGKSLVDATKKLKANTYEELMKAVGKLNSQEAPTVIQQKVRETEASIRVATLKAPLDGIHRLARGINTQLKTIIDMHGNGVKFDKVDIKDVEKLHKEVNSYAEDTTFSFGANYGHLETNKMVQTCYDWYMRFESIAKNFEVKEEK